VIAESFERIHRSNLVGMGVLPLQFKEGDNWRSLGLKGDEKVTLDGVEQVEPRQMMKATIEFHDRTVKAAEFRVRIDTADELDYFRHGGILRYVVRKLAA